MKYDLEGFSEIYSKFVFRKLSLIVAQISFCSFICFHLILILICF